jgi:hypothetical protein
MPEVANFAITLQDSTSRTVYAPIYEVPLLRARWSSALGPDGITTRLVDPSDPRLGYLARREILSVATEVARLRQQYATNPRTRGPLFDVVYPGQEAARVIQEELDRGTKAASEFEAPEVPKTLPPAELGAELDRIPGMTEAIKHSLAQAGIKDARKLAGTGIGELIRLPGLDKTSAMNMHTAAQKLLFGVRGKPADAGGKSLDAEGKPAAR